MNMESVRSLQSQIEELNEQMEEKDAKCEKYRNQVDQMKAVLQEKTDAFKQEVEKWEKQFDMAIKQRDKLEKDNQILNCRVGDLESVLDGFYGFKLLSREEAVCAYLNGVKEIFLLDTDNLAMFNISECTLNSLSKESDTTIYLESRCDE